MRNLTVEEMDIVSGGSGGLDVGALVQDIAAHADSAVSTGDVSGANGNHTASGNSVSTGDILSGNTTNALNGSLNGNANGASVEVL